MYMCNSILHTLVCLLFTLLSTCGSPSCAFHFRMGVLLTSLSRLFSFVVDALAILRKSVDEILVSKMVSLSRLSRATFKVSL